jgi:GH24 family phage-related lysozyme (muramidase)
MLTFQTITDRDAYTAQRFTFIKTVEGSESWPYIDSKGIATIGIGFNLQVDKNRDEVFKVLGINPRDSSLSEAGKAKELAYQNEIIEILKKTYPANLTGAALDQANANLQMALDAVMQRRYNDP